MIVAMASVPSGGAEGSLVWRVVWTSRREPLFHHDANLCSPSEILVF